MCTICESYGIINTFKAYKIIQNVDVKYFNVKYKTSFFIQGIVHITYNYELINISI